MDTNDLRIKVFKYSMDHFTAQGPVRRFEIVCDPNLLNRRQLQDEWLKWIPYSVTVHTKESQWSSLGRAYLVTSIQLYMVEIMSIPSIPWIISCLFHHKQLIYGTAIAFGCSIRKEEQFCKFHDRPAWWKNHPLKDYSKTMTAFCRRKQKGGRPEPN